VDKSKRKMSLGNLFLIALVLIVLILFFINFSDNKVSSGINNVFNLSESSLEDSTFTLISSTENEDLDSILKNFAKEQGIDLQIDYAGTIDIMQKLNSGEQYDAVWASNSIWLYMLDSSVVSTSNSKSTSINPVVFGITKEKAEELGFVGKEIYTQDIVDAIKNGSLKFSMSNPTQTNTGATAYLGMLTNLAGSPEVLRESHLEEENLKTELTSLFSGMERSSGSEDFLEEMFLNGNYEAVVTYEFSIINMNKKLEAEGKEPLYILYPVDGVSISDSPLALINSKNEAKSEFFTKLQSYILSDEGQNLLASMGRRTWYGGVNENADKTVFNPDWGIDTTKYIVPVKYPSTDIIKKALSMYQIELRKPVHAVFCLDYSGSMSGDGYSQLKSAMEYILNEEEASNDLLQFSEKDKITIIPFSGSVINIWSTDKGTETEELLNNISTLKPSGSTDIYDTAISALNELKDEDTDTYNLSVILMTDGMSNVGTYSRFKQIL
jgi:Ca-activated chloride channel family protein